MLSERKNMIFKAIVDEFVKTASPVGSKTLINKYGIDYSSATIRNECSDLEKEGYLEKTHTSSGRVPSSKGYRYYVDNLMDKNVGGSAEYQLSQIFDSREKDIENVLEKACEVLSDVTKLVTVVSGSNTNIEKLKKIDMLKISDNSVVVVVVTDSGNVQNKTFNVDGVKQIEDIKWCIQLFNERLIGTDTSDLVEKLNTLKPLLANQVKEHERMFQRFIQTFTQFKTKETSFSMGKGNIIHHPEFNNPERIAKVMKIIENHSTFRQMNEMNQNVLIGEEHGLGDNLTVFKANYKVNDHEGVISVIGPKRSDYNLITNSLNEIVEQIESFFNKEDK